MVSVTFAKFLSIATLMVGAASASDVVKLTGKTFDDFVSSNDVVLAEFFAPWCGHCKALAPEYEIAATQLKEKDIPIAQIDCTEEEALCADHKIDGYPTLKVFHGLDKVAPYSGARQADAIVNYMIKQSLPAVSSVDKKNADEFSTMGKFVVLGFFDDSKANTTFTDVAETLRNKFIFGSSSDAALAKKYGVEKLPAVVAFKNFEDETETAVYTDDFVADEVKNWITVESFPPIGEIGPGTFMEYTTSGLPLLYIFTDNEDDKEEIHNLIKPHAEKLKGKLHIGHLDAKLYGRHAGNVNLKEEFPALAIENFETSKKYIHSQSEPITKKSIKQFLESFADGSLQPHIKSEPIPESQDGPVYTAVGQNYEDLVLDDDKDVLLEYYAPWCGHCKNLAPIYDQLGALYFDNPEFADKVVVAKLDHTANEVPLDIRGYPTIKLFPAGKKDAPVDFNSARTLEELVAFIRDKGTHGIDGLANATTIEEEEEPIEEEEAEEVSKEAKKDSKAAKKAKKEEL